MITLAAISGLGIVCLLLEILNLRKVLVPITIIGLIGILGFTVFQLTSIDTFKDLNSNGMILATPYSVAFSILFIILAILIIAMSSSFYEDKITKIADYVSLKIFLLAGAVAMISYQNLSMFFIGIEVLSIAAYVLASSSPLNLKSNEAGMKYFLMGAFASSFILFGIALVYGATGSFDYDTIKYASFVGGVTSIWFKIGFVMILIGLLFKASVVPFHFWAPDVYEGSPTLVTALMSTLVKVAAIGTLFKVVGMMSYVMSDTLIINVIVVVSILSLVVGNITALRQTNIKRMMAYSGISHAGFMLMALLAIDNINNTILYYASAYSLAAIAAFAVILAVTRGKDNEDISNFYGLAKRNPFLAGVMSCAMLSLGGIPIFAGFFAKLFMFNQMFIAGHAILVIFGVICSIIGIFYYFSTVNVMFTKEATTKTPLKVSFGYLFVAFIAIVLNIILALCPSIVMNLPL